MVSATGVVEVVAVCGPCNDASGEQLPRLETEAVATTATTTTGDVRGTYAPSSASDGTKRLVLSIGLSVSQASETATALAVFGVTQA